MVSSRTPYNAGNIQSTYERLTSRKVPRPPIPIMSPIATMSISRDEAGTRVMPGRNTRHGRPEHASCKAEHASCKAGTRVMAGRCCPYCNNGSPRKPLPEIRSLHPPGVGINGVVTCLREAYYTNSLSIYLSIQPSIYPSSIISLSIPLSLRNTAQICNIHND